MVQTIPTKLSLTRFFQLMGVNPLHAQGVYLEDMARNANTQLTCGQPIFQYEWQRSDAASREEVARAIADAEADIESVIGYRLLPSWEEDEWVRTVRPYRAEGFNRNSRDVRGLAPVVVPKWGYTVSGGIRSVSELVASAPITYANDGRPPVAYKGQATVSFMLAYELPDCEIAVYYPGHGGDEKWRIRPVAVSHDANFTYTLTFRRELCLSEAVLESYDLQNLRGIDGTADPDFLTEVDVSRVYNDPQQQAVMLWEGTPGCASCGGGGTDCANCGYSTATACLLLRGEPRLSQLVYHPATWDADALAFSQAANWYGAQPDIVRLWYYAGWMDRRANCPATEMDYDWERTVAYMAASRLDRPLCACATPATAYWGADLAFAGGATELAVYRTTEGDLGNPFGTKRGEINAWRRCKRPGASIRGVHANTVQ